MACAHSKKNHRRAITFVEIAAMLAALAIIAVFIVPRFAGVANHSRAVQLTHKKKVVNDLLDTFTAAGGTLGATYNQGSPTTSGSLRSTSVDNLVTDLKAGAYGGVQGQIFQIVDPTFTATGLSLTGSGQAVRVQ